MLAILTIVAFVVWFALLYPMLRRAFERHVAPRNVPPLLPFLVISACAMTPFVYTVDRADGTALLDQGLSASNRLMIALTGLAGCYVLWQIARDRQVLRLPFAMPYLPFTLMILVDGLSTLWSVMPSFTAYRTAELAILFLASILLFDRTNIVRSLPVLISAFIGVWLVLVTPLFATNLAHGIIFSSAKNNMTPALCMVLLAYAVFVETGRRARFWQIALSFVGLVIAGSAASTGALVGFVPAVMVASPSRLARIAGVVVGIVFLGGFMLLTVNLSDFPVLLHFLSAVLQKPAIELAGATGRTEFWPAMISATQDHYFGSGYAAAERFLQLLIPPGEFRNLLGDTNFNPSSAHNMFLSTWSGTGLAGIALALAVLMAAVRWAMMLPLNERRFILSFTFMIILNGMTTPGLFSTWNVNLLAFAAVLAYARIAVGSRLAPSTANDEARQALASPAIPAVPVARMPP